MDIEAASQRLRNALTGAVIRCLRRQESICVAASGGLDSSVVAALAARHFDETVHLVNVSAPKGVDARRARLLARHLGLPLSEVVLSRGRVRHILPRFVGLLGTQPVDPALAQEWGVPADARFVSPVLASYELPLFVAAHEASRFGARLIVGQGADELLGGYHRYLDVEPVRLRAQLDEDLRRLQADVLPVEARIAQEAGVELRYPYLDPGVVSAAQALPAEVLVHAGERKRVLRHVATELGLPEEVAQAPKTAAQYGSGSRGILSELAEEAGLPQNEFLTRLLADAGSASSTPSVRSV